ncbi:RNA-binding S4 domain-containing protein [Metamycoplasma hominis]
MSNGRNGKIFCSVHRILINGNLANGRNAKIYPGDTVWIDDNVYLIKEQK